MKKEYITDAVKRVADENLTRFHMPGHKGKGTFNGFSGNLEKFDLTELRGLDNLHAPEGCIARSMEAMARLFGARESFFLVNGSSAGVVASVLAAVNGAHGDCSVVCARNSHKSLYNAFCLADVAPVYIMPEIIEAYGICGGVSPDTVQNAVKAANSDFAKCRAVFITSPTFEGVVSDIAEIAKAAHEHGALLIVDEAHGAHLGFSEYFPKRAISRGADIVIQSMHKTLPALGQGSVLHVSGNISGRLLENLKFYLGVMQTTSPSYLIMASLDNVRDMLENRGEALFERYVENLEFFIGEIRKLKNIDLLDESIIGKDGVFAFDKGKLTLIANGRGTKIDAFLGEKGIYIEKSDKNTALLMTSIADSREDYSKASTALRELDKIFGKSFGKRSASAAGGVAETVRLPEGGVLAKTPYNCVNSLKNTASVSIKQAVGKISAGFITPYPPGIPISAPGEIISQEIADFCENNARFIKILGYNDGFVSVSE